MTAQFNLLSRLHYRATPQRYLADVNNPLVYSLELQQRKQVLTHAHPCHSTKPRQPTADGKQHFTIFPFSGQQLVFVLFFKDVVQKAEQSLHALHSDLCQVPKVCHTSAHLPDIQPFVRHLRVILEYLWVKPFLAPITNTHWASLPLLITSTTSGRAAASAREGYFAPKASQEQQICQETWCQVCLELCSHTIPQTEPSCPPQPSSPTIHMLQRGEGAAANTGNKSGFQPSF